MQLPDELIPWAGHGGIRSYNNSAKSVDKLVANLNQTITNQTLSNEHQTNYKIIALLVFFFLLYLVFLAYCYLIVNYATDDETEQKKEEKEDTTPIPVPVQIVRMTAEERLEYFNFLFDTNGNQIELKPDQIIIIGVDKENKSTKQLDGVGTVLDHESLKEYGDLDLERQAGDCDHDNSDDRSVYLSIDIKKKTKNDHNLDCLSPEVNQKGDGRDDCEVALDQPSPVMNSRSNNIRGECIICFEYFTVGDIIVHSETCCHVYHKSCMVNYLANQRRSKRQVKEEENPLCPICRQRFCTLIGPKSAETAASPIIGPNDKSSSTTVDPPSDNDSSEITVGHNDDDDDDIERGEGIERC